MGMKEIYAKDKATYGYTDKLIKEGKLKDVWQYHPGNPDRMKVQKKKKSRYNGKGPLPA
tara:strand:- start:16 stop:192 length:177 start_codon:yes stop_codon:yes gene_type:complete